MAVVGVVVPTIGQRPQYLETTLQSIRDAGSSYIVLVGRSGFDGDQFLKSGLIDSYIDEEGPSVPEKINLGFRSLPEEIEFITWIGDDDLLAPESLAKAVSALNSPGKPVLVYGHCQYIDSEGNPVLVKRTGSWAVPLLRFGPQLIPQPSAFFRKDAFQAIGGLSDKYEFAYDFDLVYKLSRLGNCVFVDSVLSSHRWHQTSLTLSRRWDSVKEASKVRVSNLPLGLRPVSFIWELPVVVVTYLAGRFLSSDGFLAQKSNKNMH